MGEKGQGNRRQPPKTSQFKKGQSGNPTGRPKGSKNMKSVLQKELAGSIAIRENGKVKKVTKMEAGVKTLVAKSIQGDPRHTALLMKNVEKFDAGDQANRSISDTRREEILRRHEERQRARLFAEFERMQSEKSDET